MRTSSFTQLLPVYLVLFIASLGFSLIITVFTPMILNAKGGMISATTPETSRTIILGILVSLYPFGQFIGSPVLGSLSDRYGRKPILVISLLASTIGFGFISFALITKSLTVLMASLFFVGLSESNISIAQSAIADVSEGHNRSRLFGYIYFCISFAFIAGPLLGGRLAHGNTYSTPFEAVFILLLLTFFATIFLFRETKTTPPVFTSHLKSFTNLSKVFTDTKLRRFFLINFLIYMSVFGYFRCYPMYIVDQFHLTVSKSSEFIAWVSVPLIITNAWLTGFLAKRFDTRKILIFAALFTAVTVITIVIPHHQSWLWLTLFLSAFGVSLCLPFCATLLSHAADQNQQGSVMGNNMSIQVGAETLSGILGGLLATITVSTPLVALALISVVGAIILIKTKA